MSDDLSCLTKQERYEHDLIMVSVQQQKAGDLFLSKPSMREMLGVMRRLDRKVKRHSRTS